MIPEEFKETTNNMNWDQYFHNICEAVASKSPCLSRKIGAILVRDKSIVATGYNGPARGIPHCGEERFLKDIRLADELANNIPTIRKTINEMCPRQLMGFVSGEGLHWCIAEHAERNCIANAARLGVQTVKTTLYMNSVLPCKNCLTLLINAGIKEIVTESVRTYDKNSGFIYLFSEIKTRIFNKEGETNGN